MQKPSGSIKPTPHYDTTFRAPLHAMLADKNIRRDGPMRFLVTASDNIVIQIENRIEQVLPPGARFYSITHDWEQEFHVCVIDYSLRKGLTQ